jgi:hypothetical protein
MQAAKRLDGKLQVAVRQQAVSWHAAILLHQVMRSACWYAALGPWAATGIANGNWRRCVAVEGFPCM